MHKDFFMSAGHCLMIRSAIGEGRDCPATPYFFEEITLDVKNQFV